MIPDSALLGQYAESHDEAAFAELVRRHIDLVYSVALRQANGDTHLAQDATQAVFVDLARKARSLAGRETLAGWLHTSARFAAGNAVRGEVRRRVREHEAVTMHEITSAPDVNWEHLRPLLDESVGQLKEADRDAIVLRFFEGKSHEEIGALLGLSENSANKRVERALDKLREHFGRWGIIASSALLATAMIENSVQAAPAELAANVTKAALAGTGIATGGLLLKILFMSTQTKLIIAAVIVIIAAVITINWPKSGETPHLPSLAALGSPAASATAASNSPAQVVQPVVAPAIPSNSSALPAASMSTTPLPAVVATDATQFVAGPQTDLKAAITTGLHFLETQDTASFLKTLMPPNAVAGEAKGAVDDYAAQISQDPRGAQRLASMLEALNALADLVPQESPVSDRATYHLDPPVGGHKVVIFNKVDGFWYLDGM